MTSGGLTSVRRRRLQLARPAGTLPEYPSVRPLRIAFLISRLDYGGTERQLLLLSRGLRDRGHAVVVLVYRPGGALEAELRDSGVRVRVLEKHGRWDLIGFLLRLYRILRQERPHVLHSYLGVPNVMTVPIRFALRDLRIVWGERASRIERRHTDLSGRVVGTVARVLSRCSDLVIVNSHAGFDHASANGVSPDRMTVIPNGFDTNRFVPHPIAGRAVRRTWEIDDATVLVGLVARMHPIKDHRTFLAAAALLAPRRPDVRFVCVGGGDAAYRSQLRDFARERGLEQRVLWVDARADMPAVFNALDVVCSTSLSEGFPNTVGEAMACGVPCVVTDVGDSSWLLGQPSLVVPPGDAVALADCLHALLEDRERMDRVRAEVRDRIVSHFSTTRLVAATELALTDLVEASPR
jgi:glycosyltransferase involved in cell wall biosynthesis